MNTKELKARIQHLGKHGSTTDIIRTLKEYYGDATEDVLARDGYYSIDRLVGELIVGIKNEADGLYDFYQEAIDPQESRRLNYANNALGTQNMQSFMDTLERVRKDGSPYWNLNTSLEHIRPMTVTDGIMLLDDDPQGER